MRSVRAMTLGLGCVAATWPLVAGAQQADTPARTKPAARAKSAHAAGAASGPGFTIERTPAWVQPVAWDPAAPVPTAAYQILVADEQVRVQDGGSVHYQRTLRRINDTSALQQGGQIQVEFDPSYQRLVFHKIEIVRGNQRIDKLDPKKIHLLQREQQLERQVVDGRVTASLVLDDLRAGDRVDWSASVVGDNPVFGGRFADVTWDAYPNAPIGTWQLRVLAPQGRDIHARVGDPSVTSTSSVHDGLRDTVFRHANVPQLQVDERLPPAEYLKAQVELSEFADWQATAGWAAQLFAHAMQTSPLVDAQVAALQAQAPTDRAALLRATLDFVQRDVRYFGTEVGIGSHQPATADTVLRQRFGDCKDKVALLAELLTRLGFEATPVLVSATYQGATQQRLPGPLAFDHAIVRAMVDGKPVFLDATRSEQTGAIAARESLDLGFGLLARDGETALTALPDGRDSVRIETVDTFEFPRLADEGTLTSVTILHGAQAEWFRAGLASQPRSELEKAASADTLRAYPSLVATAPADFETVTEDDTVRVTSHYRTGDFWTFPEQRALVARYLLTGLIGPLRLPDQATRTQPFRLGLPGRYLHKVSFVFGEPFAGTPVSQNTDESDPTFELHLHVEAQSTREEATGELRLLTDTLAAADWQAHRDKLNKIAPKLGGVAVVPPFSPEQQAALRKDVEALVAKLRKGDPHVVTPVQATAPLKLLMYDRELAAGRLPPKLRAQVLFAQGVQLDFVDKAQAARTAFEQSLALDPTSAETHEALGANAVFRGDDATALKEADEVQRLSPSGSQPHFIRGYTHFLDGDMAAARTDFTAALQTRAEVERSYGAIWLFLAVRRAGGDGVQALHGLEPTASTPEWPYSVLQLMEGRTTFDAALQASHENGQRNLGRECELYYYAGEKALADGDTSTGRKYLRQSMATGVTEFTEFMMARRELARLGDR